MMGDEPINDLIFKLEATKGADRDLDAEIAVACGERDEGWVSKGLHHAVVPAPEYTASIDAAMTLVSELTDKTRPLKIVLGVSESGSRFGCVIQNWQWGTIVSSSRPNWPIALCIAALKARRVGRDVGLAHV